MPVNDPPRRLGRLAAVLGAALGAALVVVLVQAPAGFLALAVSHASHGRIDLGEATGTVWRGQAAVVLASGGSGGVDRSRLPGQTSWRIEPWPLLTGRLDVTLSNPAVFDTPLRLRVDRARAATLDAGTLHLPAQVLVGLGAPWNTIEPGGEIRLDWDGLQLAAGTLHGALRAEWIGASSRLCPVVPFGRYRLEADGIFPGASVRLVTLAGPMEMTGSGTIADGLHLHFQGRAQVRAGTDAAVAAQLSGLISLLGLRDGDGAILHIGT